MYYITKAGLEFLEEATLKQKIGAGVLATGAALGLGHQVHQGFKSGAIVWKSGDHNIQRTYSQPSGARQIANAKRAADDKAHQEMLKSQDRKDAPRRKRNRIRSGMEHRLKMRKILPQKQVG